MHEDLRKPRLSQVIGGHDETHNLAGILDFLNFLDEKGKSYYIKHTIPECLTVMIFLPGLKYEVYFYEDRVDYSLFQGDESVRDDLDEMLKVLSEE